MFAASVAIFLSVYNNLLVAFVPEVPASLLNVAVGGALTWFARSEGLSWAALGFHAPVRVIVLSLALAACTFALVFFVARRRPDERYRGMPRAALWARALVRVPVATALFEEVAFRGVLYAALRTEGSSIVAVGWSTVLFALWHLVGEIKRRGEAHPESSMTRVLVGAWTGATAVGVAGGVVFGIARACSGSVLPSTLLHAAINSGGMVGSALAPARNSA